MSATVPLSPMGVYTCRAIPLWSISMKALLHILRVTCRAKKSLHVKHDESLWVLIVDFIAFYSVCLFIIDTFAFSEIKANNKTSFSSHMKTMRHQWID
jgi:hypothetical protein